MLEDILQSIEKKAREEVEKIEQERVKTLQDIEYDFSQRIKQGKEQNKRALLEQNEKDVLETERNCELKYRFTLGQAKKDALDEASQQALLKINALPEEDFQKIVFALIDFLPDGFQGKIIAGKRTTLVLKDKAKAMSLGLSDGLEEEGFAAVSPLMEFDARLSQVLEQNREKTDPELLKILFQ